MKRVIVVGGGAAGLLAAGQAARRGASVLLFEKESNLGKKVLISGQTRCNLTNSGSIEDFIPMYGKNGKFLYSVFNRFFRDDLIAMLRRHGVATITERGGRVFPLSGISHDIVNAFNDDLSQTGVEVKTAEAVSDLMIKNKTVTGVCTGKGYYPAEAVILATGGMSYPVTGSTGDGYAMAADAGHRIIKLRPALVPLVVNEISLAKSMQGISLKNVRLTAFKGTIADIDRSQIPSYDCGRGIPGTRLRHPIIESRMGDMMIAHFGIGGPITLQMSLAIVDALAEGPVCVAIDCKPALSYSRLSQRLQHDFDTLGKRSLRSIMRDYLPLKMVDAVVQLAGIPPVRRGSLINADEKEKLVKIMKQLSFTIARPLPIEMAIVTAGGVALDEIDPRTMKSKMIDGLYFGGEIIDVDGDTGGYNLQAAFSTGFVAGDSAGASNGN